MRAICFVSAIIALLGLPASARPDAGFPSPSINIKIRFENLDQYPNYDFYLKYGLSRGRPAPHITKLESGTMTQLEGRGNRVTSVFLVAIAKGAPPPKAEDKQDWLSKAPPGGLQSEALPGLDNGVEATYRAHIEGETLRAEFVDSTNPEQNMLLAIAGGCISACVLFVVAVVLLVVWLWGRASKATQHGR